MNIKSSITNLHYSGEKGLMYRLLSFFAVFYKSVTDLRNFLYDKTFLKSKKVDAFVISVGNLTTGGVGKTPVVAEIAKYFLSKGEQVAVISRGYGGKLSSKNVNVISDGKEIFYNAEMAGDEPFWYAENIKALVVITCSSRVKAAEFAISKFGITKIVLDDAFQHRKIKRDLDLVLVDSEKRFGNESVLPAGPLREDMKSLARADKIIVVCKGSKDYSKVLEFAKDLNAQICDMAPAEVYNINDGTKLADNVTVTAMCAIGQPQQFFNFLTSRFNVVKKIVFDDHHLYKKKDIPIVNIPIITTEKDAVKIKSFGFKNIYALKLRLNLNCEMLFNDKNNY